MFISSYTTICFFRREIYIFECLHLRYSNVFIFFLAEKGAIDSVRTQLVGRWGHPKYIQLRTGGGGATPHVYVGT